MTTHDLHPEDIAKAAEKIELPKAEPKKNLDVRAIQMTLDNFQTICTFLSSQEHVMSYIGKFAYTGGSDESPSISMEIRLRGRPNPLFLSHMDYLVVNDEDKLSCMKGFAFEKIYDL